MPTRHALLLCILALVCLPGATLADTYLLTVDPKKPYSGRVTLTFQKAAGPAATLQVRTLPDASATPEPWCTAPKAKLALIEAQWWVPEGCLAASWDVTFLEASGADYAVAKQENLHHPAGWWVLSEWGSLLRTSPEGGDVVCVRVGAHADDCRTLPATSQPPLLLVFGRPDQVRSIGGLKLRLYSDNVTGKLNIGDVFSTFGQQLDYLTGLMPTFPASLPDKPIDVAWLSIAPSHGTTSGAGGVDSILANYVTNKTGDKVPETEVFRLLWVSAHEMLHLLGINTNRIWASESLATYYAFKSFDTLRQRDEATAFFAQLEAESDPSIGILAAQRLLDEGYGQHMAVIYGRGAAFWRDIDHGIHAASNGALDLDDFLHVLLASPFPETRLLPASFEVSLREQLPHFEVGTIVQQYR